VPNGTHLRNAEADFELELTLNHGRSETYQLGDGYGHIAFVVDGVRAEHARFTSLGLSPTPVKELNHEAQVLTRFPFVQDPDGHRVEVLQRQGRCS
jgi:lactoylglutathione lyase